MKKTYYIGLVVLLFLVIAIVAPRNFERTKKTAFHEFEDFLDEYNIDKKFFTGPQLIPEKEDYHIFQWQAIINKEDTLFVRIFVPHRIYKSPIVSLTGVNENWEEVFNTAPNN